MKEAELQEASDERKRQLEELAAYHQDVEDAVKEVKKKRMSTDGNSVIPNILFQREMDEFRLIES